MLLCAVCTDNFGLVIAVCGGGVGCGGGAFMSILLFFIFMHVLVCVMTTTWYNEGR